MTITDKIRNFCLGKEDAKKLQTIQSLVKETYTLEDFDIKYDFEESQLDHDVEMSNVIHDIELFDVSENLFDDLFSKHTNLYGTKKLLRFVLEHPISDVDVLNKRKDILKRYSNNIPQDKLDLLKSLEDSLPWIMNPNSTEDIQAAYSLVFFNTKITQPLNFVPKALTSINIYKILVSPVIGLMSPIVYLFVPFLILTFKFKVKIGFVSYVKMLFSGLMMGTMNMGSLQYVSLLLSLVFYFQGIFNSLEISKASYTISKYITNNINKVSVFLSTGYDLVNQAWSDEINEYFFNNDGKEDICETCEIKKCNPFTLLSDFGNSLKEYKVFSKEKIVPLIKRIYKLDLMYSICNIKSANNFKYPIYSTEKKPLLMLKGLYHPFLKHPIKNDIEIGNPRNFILTGPNAGGKSTLIKSILINIILSQTLTLCNSDKCIITPFKYIASQINIPDCKGKESLFEAEMFRAKNTLDKLKECKGFSFIVLDEIFNSTNPIEGISGAFSILKKISSFENNMSIVATHYLYLTRLEKQHPDRFTNIKINLNKDDRGHISFPYKISKGISKQWIALELLKMNGFDEDIINEAIDIKSRFISQKKLS